MPSSRGSSQPRDWTQVSHIADRFFTVWANCTQNNQDNAGQITSDQFQNDCQSWLCFSARSPLPLPREALAHWLSGRWGNGLWTGVHLPHWLPASKIKQTFLSTNLASLMAFERQAARPYFWLQQHNTYYAYLLSSCPLTHPFLAP